MYIYIYIYTYNKHSSFRWSISTSRLPRCAHVQERSFAAGTLEGEHMWSYITLNTRWNNCEHGSPIRLTKLLSNQVLVREGSCARVDPSCENASHPLCIAVSPTGGPVIRIICACASFRAFYQSFM